MAIDRKAIEEHKAQLIEQEKRLLADLHATSGAIQNCDYFLSLIDKPAAGEKEGEST